MYFFKSETVETIKKWAPRYPFKCCPNAANANASSSITTAIGAKLPTPSVSACIPNIKPPGY